MTESTTVPFCESATLSHLGEYVLVPSSIPNDIVEIVPSKERYNKNRQKYGTAPMHVTM